MMKMSHPSCAAISSDLIQVRQPKAFHCIFRSGPGVSGSVALSFRGSAGAKQQLIDNPASALFWFSDINNCSLSKNGAHLHFSPN
jgi:hypothetical protein